MEPGEDGACAFVILSTTLTEAVTDSHQLWGRISVLSKGLIGT